ncbi:MAG: glycoside hydrolase family 88 protein [Anaerolineales bacterium]|nr:glycoside hydrolase family 88 protein [Anaerolineales bacterium]
MSDQVVPSETNAASKVDERQWVPRALAFSIGRISQNMIRLPHFPEYTRGDRWVFVKDGGWVGGHWVGLLWLAFAYTRDREMERQARKWAARLSARQSDTTTHDLGFLFELSHVLGANLTGDEALKGPALQAARTLTRRFNRQGGFFQAWGGLDASAAQRGGAIIDTMMNLDLLFWASREAADSYFAEQALAHARTCLRHQVRPDFSTAHGADFDPETGEFIKLSTYQGLSAASCWSRGHAWAVYGFADCYRATKDSLFLATARSLAEHALGRLPEDLIPYWDYDSPLIPHDVRDSSAAAILGSGLLYLAALEPDSALAERWTCTAGKILRSLWENYTSRASLEPSLLIHATRSKPEGFMDHGLIYGDYYFVEGLLRLSDPVMASNLH